MSFTERFFNITTALLLITGLFIFFTPLIGITELIYPQRIDSAYVRLQELEYKRRASPDVSIPPENFYVLPSQHRMGYRNIVLPAYEGTAAKAWFIPGYRYAATLIIIHDLNESRINWLIAARQFNDRGFNIALVDLPAHGESGGHIFHLGERELPVIMALIDSIYPKVVSRNIAVLGKGIGAGIALTASLNDSRINCVIAQSIPDRQSDYIGLYAERKWGALNSLLYPVMKRNLYGILNFNPDTVSYSERAAKAPVPVMFLAGSLDKSVPYLYTRSVYNACMASKKEFWLVKGANHNSVEEEAGEEYYNRISVFMVNSFPKAIRKSRFRKLVYLQTGHS
jgi:uncharacterized protein